MLPTTDGYTKFQKYRTYYKIVGEQTDKSKLPLLVLAGGPGSPHNYLLDLQWIAKSGRQVIFYDQLGCGKSSRPTNSSIWKIDLFIRELKNLRRQLGLNDVHLLGHSWGGMLAIEYLLTKPKGVHSVILASTMISIPLFQEEVNKLKQKLPSGVQQTLERHEKNGTTDSPEYKKAYQQYSKQHIFRPDNWPGHLSAPPDSFGKSVYQTMWGPSEAYANGTLKKWDRINSLAEITIPVLITSGKYDEVTPKQAKLTQSKISNSRWILFEHSAHMPQAEEAGAYREAIENFLAEVPQE